MKSNTLYKLAIPKSYHGYEQYYYDLLGVTGSNSNQAVLCLGELTNMKEHYIMVGPNGLVRYGLHDDIFTELSEDEM